VQTLQELGTKLRGQRSQNASLHLPELWVRVAHDGRTLVGECDFIGPCVGFRPAPLHELLADEAVHELRKGIAIKPCGFGQPRLSCVGIAIDPNEQRQLLTGQTGLDANQLVKNLA